MNIRIITITLFSFLIACNTSHQPGTQTGDQPTDEPVEETTFSFHPQGPFFIHLEGVIGEYPVNMELMHFPDFYDTGSGYQGHYYYQKYGQPIAFYGAEEEPGLISLTESDIEGGITGNFRGQLNEEGIFQGRWISGDQKRMLPFTLQPVADQTGLSFNLLTFSDSLVIETGADDAPSVFVQQQWLYPGTAPNPELLTFLRTEIRKSMVGDSLANLYPNPKAAFDAGKESYFQEFREETAAQLEYEQDNPGEGAWMMDYTFSQDMEVYYLSPTLLTLGFAEYYYTGGAHGNYGTSVSSYDLHAQKVINLSDVFHPGYEGALTEILTAQARQLYEVEPTQPLSNFFFVDEINPTENFGLTDKGIFFVYNPYEIAAYVFGQIELFVSFEDVKEWRK